MGDPISTAQSALSDATSLALQCVSNAQSLGEAISNAAEALKGFSIPTTKMKVLSLDPTAKSDVTLDFQTAIASGGCYYLPAGNYLINPLVMIRPNPGTILLMHPRATLIAKPNNASRAYVIFIKDVSDIDIIGGNILGDRDTHDYSAGGTFEWNHGVMVSGGKNIRFMDINISRCAGDGLSTSGSSIMLSGVNSTMNRRQGWTIGTGDTYLGVDCNFSDNGNVGLSKGTPPMSGIDIEPDRGTVQNVVLQRVKVHGNTVTGLVMWLRTEANAWIKNVLVDDCDISGDVSDVDGSPDGGSGIDVKAVLNTVDGFVIQNSRLGPQRGYSLKIGGGVRNLKVQNNTFTKFGTPRKAVTLVGVKTQYDILLAPDTTGDVLTNFYN